MSGKRWLAIALLLLGVGGIELTIWRNGQRNSGSSSYTETRAIQPLEDFPHLKPGEQALEFEAERLDGGSERIDYPLDGPKTYLFLMSPTCGKCARTVPKWNRMASQLEGRARVLGIVLGSYQTEQRLLEKKVLAFPAVRFPSKEILNAYKVKKVPQTLVVAPGGTVEESVMGALNDQQVEELVALAKLGDETGS